MATIKIDDELLKKIKKFIKEGENRFDYPNVKAFVDKEINLALKKLIKAKNIKYLNHNKIKRDTAKNDFQN